MKAQSTSPGIYAVFKVYLIVQVILDITATMVRFASIPPMPEQAAPRPPMPPPGGSAFGGVDIMSAAGLAPVALNLLLLGYLSWGWLRGKMGIFHLPVALAAATLSPLVMDFWSGSRYWQHMSAMPGPLRTPWMDQSFYQFALSGQFQVTLLLLMPLTLVAWRYRYRWVVIYCLLITAVSMGSVFSIVQHSVSQGRIFWVLFSRLLFYLVFGYIVARLLNEQRKITAQLESANASLTTYANTAEQLAISRERNRLAREVHDTLAHTLSALAVQLEAVNTLWESDVQKSRQILRQTLMQTRQGLYETRRAIQAMRASPLEDLGLLLAMKSLAYATADRCGFTVSLDLPAELHGLDANLEHTLYRILEEALHNVGSHAMAQQVRVQLGNTPGKFFLTIQDDGLGFDPQAAREGERYGLRGMRERTEAVGARFQIESAPGKGTTIYVEWEER